MKGIRLVGILVMGVVWGGLARRLSGSVDGKQKWIRHSKEWGEAEEGLRDCFNGQKALRYQQAMSMTMQGGWTTQTIAQLLTEGKQPGKGHFRVRKTCWRLWLTTIAQECGSGGRGKLATEPGKVEWCKLHAYETGGNIALPCTSEQHNAQFITLSKLVQDAERNKSDEKVTFSEANPNNQSFLCALQLETETLSATQDMPKTKQEVGGKTYTLDDRDPREWKTDSNCYYNMTWLGQTVANYQCPVPEPQNCEEAIKRAFEVEHKKNFKDCKASVEGGTQSRERVTLDGRTCKLKEEATSPRSAEAVPKKFTLTGDNTQKGEIWCASIPQGEPKNIPCRFFPPCEVEIREAFGSKYSGDVNVNFKDPQTQQSNLAGRRCSRKKDGRNNENATLDFFFSDKEDGNPSDGELSCSLQGNPIKCTFHPSCAYTVKSAFTSEKPAVGKIEKIARRNQADLDLNNATCDETQITRGEGKTFEITNNVGTGAKAGDEIFCKNSSGTAITCVLLPQCEVEIKKAFKKVGKSPTTFDGQVTDEEGTRQSVALSKFPNGCQPFADNPSPSSLSGKEPLKFTATKDDFTRTLSCELGAQDTKITCTALPFTCEQRIRREFNKIGAGTKVEMKDESTGFKFEGKKCTTKSPSSSVAKFFQITSEDSGSHGEEISCTAGGKDITCRILSECEVTIREGFNRQWRENEITYGSKHQDESSTTALPPKCTIRQDSPAIGGSTEKFTLDGSVAEKGQIWCTFPGQGSGTGKITCELFSPCEVKIREEFWKACTKVDITKRAELGGGGIDKKDLPKECRIVGDRTRQRTQNCGNGAAKLTFKVENNGNDLKDRMFTCQLGVESEISCTILPLTCKETVQQEYKAKCSGSDAKRVTFEGDIGQLGNKGGTNPEDKCPLALTDGQESCRNGNPIKFQITSEIRGNLKGRRISCKDHGGTIQCDLLPPTCQEYVGEEFRVKCKEGTPKTGEVKFEKEAQSFGTKGGNNLTDYCPLQHTEHPKHKDKACSGNSGKMLVFKVANGTNVNRDILCNFAESGISCSLVDFTCAQAIQQEFKQPISHSSESFTEKVMMDGASTKADDLNNETCVATSEKNEDAEKTFNLTSGTNGEREILCKNDKTPISCTLLPPRCEVGNYARNDEKPLRCKETGNSGNITFSRADLQETVMCQNKESQDNKVRREACRVNVTKIGGNGENMPFYCKTSDVKNIFKEDVCTPLAMIDAKMCPLTDLNFENNSACDINEVTGDLSIPKTIFKEFHGKVKELKKHCNETDNKHKIEERCAVKISFGEATMGDKYYHCPSDNVKTFKKNVKEICDETKIPSHLSRQSYFSSQETVKIHFQTEEHHDEEKGTRGRKITFIRKPLSPPEPWDIDDSFASFHSPLYLLILALF